MTRPRTVAAMLLLLAACSGSSADRERAGAPAGRDSAPAVASIDARAGVVVDSIIPIDEALRRFRTGLGDAPAVLAGSDTRDALVERFARAVVTRDTSALRDMALSRREFAYLYYPESPLSRPPYQEPPALLWFRVSEGSGRGLARLLRRHGGQPLRLAGYACEATPKREGRNTLWERCRVRHVRAEGDTVSARLFGSIVERGGRFKFVGYANDF